MFWPSTANCGQWADNSHCNPNVQHAFSSHGSKTCSAHALDYLGNQGRMQTAAANASLFLWEANTHMQTLQTQVNGGLLTSHLVDPRMHHDEHKPSPYESSMFNSCLSLARNKWIAQWMQSASNSLKSWMRLFFTTHTHNTRSVWNCGYQSKASGEITCTPSNPFA